MNNCKQMSVWMAGRKVGTLAENAGRLIAFAYEDSWLADGFAISPLSLPLRKEVFLPAKFDPFDGLFGVFADSLPDGWGRLLVDRFLLKNGMAPAEFRSLDRLSVIGDTGAGALSYEPASERPDAVGNRSLDLLARECKKILASKESDDLDALFRLGGSSGGARPKIFHKIDGEEWIVKFPSSMDRDDIGEQEYAYSLCARECGIEMSETRLLPSQICSGYFATKRFDRNGEKRRHMISVSAVLETSHRIPNLDYNTLMRLTLCLTGDYGEIEKLYRQMCFNVFAHNRDDHSKNFSFLYDEENARWILSPAYDLTYSSSIGGEHATTVNGNGVNPGMSDLLAVAENIKLDRKKARKIAEEIQEIVRVSLRGRGLFPCTDKA